ncbi:MAG: PAS domain-containing hybrid sensor histidine kinase/response regulator, partial [Gemmatimonadales bacterium]
MTPPEAREDSHFGYLQCTPDGRILGASPQLARLLGDSSVPSMVDRAPSLLDLYADDADRRRVQGRLRDSLPADEARWLRADGTSVWVRTRLWPVTHADYGGVAFEIQVEDVTERRHLEEQLRQAQKMESVGQLAGGMAHDLNNLLTVILSQLDFALTCLREGELEEAEQDLADARDAAHRGTRMVQHLLAFSRRDHLKLEPTDLSEMVDRGSHLLRRLLPDGIEIRTRGKGPIRVLADASAVEQILLNLATNARDGMEGRGTLTLRHGRETMTEEDVARQGWGRTESFGTLTVADTGTGMSPQVVARVFEPFFTTKAAGRGTGLGLPMVYGLMKQHRGFVTLESEEGRGTKVTLWFPLATSDADDPTSPVPDTDTSSPAPATDHGPDACDPEGSREAGHPETGRHRPQILVVDDDEILRRVTARALRTREYRVVEAADGLEALEIVEEFGPPDLVISDLVMPGLTGPELLEHLRASYPGQPFLMTSGHGSGSLAREEGMPPELPFLAKPWTVSELL